MLIKNSEIAVSACFSFIQENRSKRRENVKVSTWKDRGTAIAPKNAPLAQSFLVCSQCELNIFLRSEEHTSELQSLMRISYAVFCLKNKHTTKQHTQYQNKTTKNYHLIQH